MGSKDYASFLRRCAYSRSLSQGRRGHALIAAIDGHGRDRNDTFLANLLLQMYSRCGSLRDARTVFERIHRKDVVSWNSIISAYAQNGHPKHAQDLFCQMQAQGIPPDKFTFLPLLGSAAILRDLNWGKRIHKHIIDLDLEQDVLMRSALVSMYGKCGSLSNAQEVFSQIQIWDVVSCNAMISACVQNGNGEKALETFCQMELNGLKPTKITFLSVLTACDNPSLLEKGREIHERIVRYGFDSDAPVMNALVHMYGQCSSPKDAQIAFDAIWKKNVISWNSMIAAYAHNGLAKEAIGLFYQMEMGHLKPDKITYLNTLDACASLASLENGRAIHEHIVLNGFESNIAIQTALLKMYGKCNSLKDARSIFDQMLHHDVISWTAMIAAYAQNGLGCEALELLKQMETESVKPNEVTFLSILGACSGENGLENGRAIHKRIITNGFESDVSLCNALITMYGKCGSLTNALEVFEGMHRRDVVSWTATIATYVQNGHAEEAVELFLDMVSQHIEPCRSTYLNVLGACAALGSSHHGRLIHRQIVANGFQSDVALMTAALNMYGKCGALEDARSVFDEMHHRNIISWNAMIATYAHNGCGKEALKLFEKMILGGLKPDGSTFLSIVSACSYAGLLNLGWDYFVSMIESYDITPTVEHYMCMIDLLGRGGHLAEGEAFIRNMPTRFDAVAWTTLLGTCQIYGDINQGSEDTLDLD